MSNFVETKVLVHLEAIGEVRACVMLLDSTLKPGVRESQMTELSATTSWHSTESERTGHAHGSEWERNEN